MTSTPEASASPRVERSSLREQVRRILRMQVLTGELEPGKLHSVGEFVGVLGVSATPVREALGDLEQLGLVHVIRNRGFVVPPLTAHDLDEIFELRTMLEVAAVERLSAEDLPDEAVATCRETVARCLRAATEGDATGFLEADRDFHLELVGLLGNRRLVEIVDRVRDQTRLYGLLKLSPIRLVGFAKEHEALLEAIIGKDADRAASGLIRHLSHTRALWAAADGAIR